MALEEQISKMNDLLREQIDATNRNTAVTESLMSLRAEAIEKVKGEATPAKKAPAKTESKPEITANPEDRKPPEEKGAVDAGAYDQLKAAIQGYVGFDDTEAGRKERQANVKKIFSHDKIKAAKHTDVPEAMIPTVVKNLVKLTEAAAAAAAAAATGSDDDDDLVG